MFYHLPPVGNPVCLHSHGPISHGQAQTDSAATLFSSNQAQFYASGTAALAAAVVAAMKVKSFESAEVILPAYGCPDLVCAVEFAGAKPVLVDIEADRPWLDLTQLVLAITENTAAIVAVNLFGINERWSQLRELAERNDIVLIEDSAQYFPGGEERQDWQGDLVVLSFGRGKPVSLLGGGAVLTKKAFMFEQLPKPQSITAGFSQRLLFGLKTRLYNAMTSPLLYWLPQMMPFLHLGETHYYVLPDIKAMDQIRANLLASNISCYQADAKAPGRCKKISVMLNSIAGVIDLPQVCDMKVNRRLLRYPFLVESVERDRMYRKLHHAGLGASRMYPASLPEIDGLNHIFDKKYNFPNAQDFASRLITLPTHSSVADKDIDRMKTLLS